MVAVLLPQTVEEAQIRGLKATSLPPLYEVLPAKDGHHTEEPEPARDGPN